MKNRIFGAILGLSMMTALLPTAAFAAGTGAMASGTGGIADGSIVYFGQYTDGGSTYEVPWLVLDANKTNTNTEGAFLISKYLLGSTPFEAAWDGDDNDGQDQPNEWQNSDAQAWSNSFADSDHFTAAELSAMLATTKIDGQYMAYGASELKGEKAFFLSGEEAATYFHSDKEREAAFITHPAGSTAWWWLRSPYGDKPYNAGVVSVVQRYTRVSYADGARPAFNLGLSSVLFSSAAQGGKLSGTVGAAAMEAVSSGSPSEWKLTLLDNSRPFRAERTEYNAVSKVMTIGYTGATVGANEYISAVVMERNGTVKYYGNIAKPQNVSGSVKIDLSGVILGTDDKLYVFSEAANGDKKTDYASALQEMSISGSSSGGGSNGTTDPKPPVKEDKEDSPVWENQFADVKEADWFYGAVKYVYEKGLMKGVSDTAFSPTATTMRAMLVTILYRLEGSPAVSATNPFSDVAAGKYYDDAVIWAVANKIVSGNGNGKFGPEDPITREQMAAILYRYASFKGYDVSARADLSAFSDADSVSAYAKDAMAWANAKGLIQGYGTKLTPKSNALRAQMAAIIQRFLES